MRVLVVGNGGREHAIAWSLVQSSKVEQVLCTPGNGGTAVMEKCMNVAAEGFEEIANIVQKHQIDLVVVGPEVPLAQGITDYLQSYQIKVFGPTKAGAQIEASKSWAKELMEEAGIPTATGKTFTDVIAAKEYINCQQPPLVVKADSLAAGKGVLVTDDIPEAVAFVDSLWQQGFTTIVVEEYLRGYEVSILALTDGTTIMPLLPAQDHKRIGDGDTGGNTGGMGAYTPVLLTPELTEQIQKDILEPTLKALRDRGIDYRGILYAGLMITPSGAAKVLEFNCRFGDPETQAILPLLATPLEEVLMACVEGRLPEVVIEWKPHKAVCVVVASGGYPGVYATGKVIKGIAAAESKGAVVFHAGTKLVEGEIVTSGGRVLGVTALGDSWESAIEQVYLAVKELDFEGIYYRSDIAHKRATHLECVARFGIGNGQ